MRQIHTLSLPQPPALPHFHPTRYVVIGLGGIGSIVAEQLGRFLMNRQPHAPLCLVDGDHYEEHNRSRMRFESYENKAVAKAQELAAHTRRTVTIHPTAAYVTDANIGGIIRENDCVLLCVDNHATRKLVNGHCLSLHTVALFSGGNDGVDDTHSGTFGNVQVMIRQDSRNLTNSLTAYHPEITQPADRHPEDLGCEELAPTLPQLLFTNLAVASAMLSAIYAWLQGRLSHEEVYLDILSGRAIPIRRAVK